MRRVFIIGALLLLPSLAAAAGFAKESLFLSTAHPTEGATVLIHAIVSNESSSAFTGTLGFAEDESSIGTVPVSLTVGEAGVFSVSWKPAAGEHTVVATLKDAGGAVLGQESKTFSVAAPPAPATNEPTTDATGDVDSSADIQQSIANFSPQTAQAISPGFAIIDSARTKAAEALDKGITWAKEQTGEKSSGAVLGAETKKDTGITGQLWFIVSSIVLITLSILRWAVAHAGVFYPILAVAFLYGLWRLYKRMRRPAWER